MSSKMEGPLQDVGRLIAKAVDGNPDGAFLYAEVEPGMVSWGLFIDRGEYVQYISHDDGVRNALINLWNAVDSEKKWSGVSYAIVQGSLDAQFYYSESWIDDEIYPDRRKRILTERYGDKPIKYPPPPSDAMEL